MFESLMHCMTSLVIGAGFAWVFVFVSCTSDGSTVLFRVVTGTLPAGSADVSQRFLRSFR